MKFIVHLLAVLFGFVILCSPAACLADNTASEDTRSDTLENAAEAAPELYIPVKSHQFENVPAGQTVTHDFVLHNRGTAPLHITGVKTG